MTYKTPLMFSSALFDLVTWLNPSCKTLSGVERAHVNGTSDLKNFRGDNNQLIPQYVPFFFLFKHKSSYKGAANSHWGSGTRERIFKTSCLHLSIRWSQASPPPAPPQLLFASLGGKTGGIFICLFPKWAIIAMTRIWFGFRNGTEGASILPPPPLL